MAFFVDLHVHTRAGSPDSAIRPEELGPRLRALGQLDGIVLAEHSLKWMPEDASRLEESSGKFVVNAREYGTDSGHVIVIGVPEAIVRGVRTVAHLRDIVSAAGGVMILAHPFRYFPGPGSLLFPESGAVSLAETFHPPAVEEAASHPIFRLVDAVEVLNHGSTGTENRMANAVAAHLGLPGVGGSDAHDIYSVGRHATAFPRRLESEQDLINAIRCGECWAVRRTADGYVRAETT